MMTGECINNLNEHERVLQCCSIVDSRRSSRLLSLTQILSFLQCDSSSRCFVEGEWVVDAEHLILVSTSGPASASGVLKVVTLCV